VELFTEPSPSASVSPLYYRRDWVRAITLRDQISSIALCQAQRITCGRDRMIHPYPAPTNFPATLPKISVVKDCSLVTKLSGFVLDTQVFWIQLDAIHIPCSSQRRRTNGAFLLMDIPSRRTRYHGPSKVAARGLEMACSVPRLRAAAIML